MKLEDVMTRRPLTTTSDDDVELALQIMAWGEVRHLPVVDHAKVVGVVSERDLLKSRGDNPLVVAVMTAPPQVAGPGDDVEEAAARMLRERLGCLPVVANGALVGIVTVTDVLTARVSPAAPREIERVTVGEAMTRNPLTVSPEDGFVDAVAAMSARNVRHVPVVDGDRRVIGIVSDRDARLAVGDVMVRDPGDGPVRIGLLRVRDVMSPDPIVVEESTSLLEASSCLRSKKIGALPVVDRAGRIVGILSYVDVLDEVLRQRHGARADRGPVSPFPRAVP